MKTILLAYMILLTTVLVSSAVADEEQDTFLRTAKQDYQRLLLKLPSSRQAHWKHEHFKMALSQEEWLQSSDQNGIQGFRFLAEFGIKELNDATKLLNSVGREILDSQLKSRIDPIISDMQISLDLHREKGGSDRLYNLATTLFSVKQEVDRLRRNPPVKLKYTFAPRSSAYDSTPRIVGEYFVYSWDASIDRIAELESLISIARDALSAEKYLRIQDPSAAVSLSLQISFLLVAVAGYIISYLGKPSVVLVALLVLAGMVLSCFMVFISSHTLLNVIVQSIIPGAFILWWVIKKKRKSISNNKNVQETGIEICHRSSLHVE